ncbi:hypothetical protein SAMN05660420_00899 [Desulfuromusa kysingii]|uniref:Uncharacterized protein n=1 Tax=Desulfuromusa kysingii TaxID=37625 RepID=A0A1H3XDI1_9BACT|nr:hypothetical protein SAMN05660420_00899 [Desulfuromusa kysingii]
MGISTSALFWTGVAPLQEISINDAQTRLISRMTNRNMGRNLAEECTRINN